LKKFVSIVALAFGVAFLLAGTALGAGRSGELRSTVIGSAPGVVIAGVPSGGAPWTVADGEARVSADGELRVEVEGLLLINTGNPALDGTVGPVRGVFASLVCGGTVVASTSTVPLNSAGDAEIRANVSVPQSCFAPSVLVRIGALATGPVQGPWIAATGL
jgi:hypothetical protein